MHSIIFCMLSSKGNELVIGINYEVEKYSWLYQIPGYQKINLFHWKALVDDLMISVLYYLEKRLGWLFW